MSLEVEDEANAISDLKCTPWHTRACFHMLRHYLCAHVLTYIPRKHFILTAVVMIFVNFSDGFEFWLFWKA